MNQPDAIAKILLDMIPGPDGQITQRAIITALNKAYREGWYAGSLALANFPKKVKHVEPTNTQSK